MKKQIVLTISGIATVSDVFMEQFGQFNEKVWEYIKEFFPDFQPDHPPVTVTVHDRENCEKCGREGTVYPNPFNQAKQCHHCGYAVSKTRAVIVKRLGESEWIQEPVFYTDFSAVYSQALKSLERGFEVAIMLEKSEGE